MIYQREEPVMNPVARLIFAKVVEEKQAHAHDSGEQPRAIPLVITNRPICRAQRFHQLNAGQETHAVRRACVLRENRASKANHEAGLANAIPADENESPLASPAVEEFADTSVGGSRVSRKRRITVESNAALAWRDASCAPELLGLSRAQSRRERLPLRATACVADRAMNYACLSAYSAIAGMLCDPLYTFALTRLRFHPQALFLPRHHCLRALDQFNYHAVITEGSQLSLVRYRLDCWIDG
jgi:hypothetical protein